MIRAKRMRNLASAVFSDMDRLRQEVEAKGVRTINLSIGSPDRPPARHVQDALIKAVSDPSQYGYALTEGLPDFKKAVSAWYKQRFDVSLDPENEVLSLMGSQDGLAHIYLAYVDEGDYVLLPDPGYPVYSAGLHLAGGKIFPLTLSEKRGFLPDFEEVPAEIAHKAKMMVLNYPSNPLAAVADLEFFNKAVEFAQKNNIIICHDIAYSELAFDGYRPPSFLQVPGAKDVGVEFHSLSKTFNLAGARLGFVVGNAEIINDLTKIKSNIDYGVFKPVQQAGIAALLGPQAWVAENAKVYERRRNVLVEGLNEIGWKVPKPKASMFIWAPLPQCYRDSMAFAEELLRKSGVLVVPGIGFGAKGEGFVRIALVQEEDMLKEAINRIKLNFDLK